MLLDALNAQYKKYKKNKSLMELRGEMLKKKWGNKPYSEMF